jgi:hypothetical protein
LLVAISKSQNVAGLLATTKDAGHSLRRRDIAEKDRIAGGVILYSVFLVF